MWRRTLSLRAKLLMLMLGFAIVPAPVVALLALDAFESSTYESTIESLEGLASAKAEAIDQYINARKGEVQGLARLLSEAVGRLPFAAPAPTRAPDPKPLPDLEDAEKLNDGKPPEHKTTDGAPPAPAVEPPEVVESRRTLARMMALLLGDQSVFEELLVMAPDGRVVFSTFSDHRNKSAADVEYFKRGRAATYIQPVFASPITNELTMVIATPIRDDAGTTLGVLAARLNLARFYLLINDSTGLGKTGETVVAKLIGDKPLLMAPPRHEPDAELLEARSRYDLSATPMASAVRGATGRGRALDYRGHEVLAAWGFAPTMEWGVVAKIDVSEAFSAYHRVKARVIAITGLIAALAILLSLIIAGAMIAPLRKLKIATERISKGDLDVALEIRSRDEIGELADSFERMVAAIKFFREQSRSSDDDGDAVDEEA